MTGAVIVAAGAGQRLGAHVPKGLAPLHGRPLFHYSAVAASECSAISRTVVVVPEAYVDAARSHITSALAEVPVSVTAGGPSRRDSTLLGLEALTDVEWVAVHDAARPLVSPDLFAGVIQAAREHGGAIAAHPATDTIKRKFPDGLLQSLPREQLWHAETPQVFKRDLLISALREMVNAGEQVTDDAEAMERCGHPVAIYENPHLNLKISSPADWQLAESLLSPDDDVA